MRTKYNRWFKQTAEKISANEEEREIVQYGLQQSIILVNMVSTIAVALIWTELIFSIFVFLGLYLLRPYAGGYHADSKINCYLISLSVINLSIIVRKLSILSGLSIYGYLFFTLIICLYAPIQNPIHALTIIEEIEYGRKTRRILIGFSLLWVWGYFFRPGILKDAISAIVGITAISMIAGRIKYRRFYNQRRERGSGCIEKF